ncbi:BLUF domain-containing protein [Pelagibius sp.]|uniref:BLUF domain-containing protein n=1 Tax=Pelagibius sp. TaxID=1931238 RepID=UPI003BAFE8DB
MYISTSKQAMGEQELEAILSVAREKNIDLGVSGLLLYVDRHFLQYLEGEQGVVEDLYRHIEKDERHSGVMRLFAGLYDRRIFTDWSMGFHRLSEDEQAELSGAIDLCKNSVRDTLPEEAPEEIVIFMESFYRTSKGLRDHA